MDKLEEIEFYGHEWDRLWEENTYMHNQLNRKRYRSIDKILYPLDTKKNKKQKSLLKKETVVTAKKTKQKPQKIQSKRVDIINNNFYDWDGKEVYKGGAERYVYDLSQLLISMGYQPRIIQGANKDFKKRFKGIEVVGFKIEGLRIEKLSKRFNEVTKDARLIIASPMELASEITNGRPMIGINHGVNFDHYSNTFYKTIRNHHLEHFKALVHLQECVCVDTNFINWVRTIDNSLSLKLSYIPNYYNEQDFKYISKSFKGQLTCVYPRRIYAARGSDITISAFSRLLKKYPKELKLHLVGTYSNKSDEKAVNELIKKYPNNVKHFEYCMEDMPKAYDDADVVLIPTRCSEGTSLSCIEAMASGAVVVASNVGGLPNLIIDNFNGKLISPTADSLEQAIEWLLKNRQKCREMSKVAALVAKNSFEKNIWNKKWKAILSEVLAKTP